MLLTFSITSLKELLALVIGDRQKIVLLPLSRLTTIEIKLFPDLGAE